MAPIIPASEIIFQFTAEFFGDGGVFEEGGVFPIAVRGSEGFGGDVLCYPRGIA
jgi:hypothetical protein